MRAQSKQTLTIIVLLLALAATAWLGWRFVSDYPGGAYFNSLWNGGRGFLTQGVSVYGAEVQAAVTRSAQSWERQPEPWRGLFNYPFYVLLPALPFLMIADYNLARLLWLLAALCALLLTFWAGQRLAGWRLKPLTFAGALLFLLLNPYTVSALVTGDWAVFTLPLVALALLALRAGLDELGGLALAFTTITPALALPLLALITLWAISQRRDRLLLWTWGGTGLLIAGSWLARPDWLEGYIQVLGEAYQLEGVFTPGQALRSWWPGFGAQMGWILTAGLGLSLLNEWRKAWGKEPRWLIWTAALTLTAGPLLGLRIDPASLAVALLPLLLVAGWWDERWGGCAGWSSALILLLLLLGLWALIPRGIDDLAHPGIYPVLFLPLPFFTMLGLYWVRWLALRPRGTLLDELRQRGDL